MGLLRNHMHKLLGPSAKWAMAFGTALLAVALHGQAGFGVNADGASPHPATVLDVDGSALPANDQKGLLIPTVGLHSALFTTAPTGTFPNPFLLHGASTTMPHSLWIYSETTRSFGGTGSQYGITPNFYWWEPEGNRYIKQELQIGPTHHHTSTGSVVLTADGVYLPVPGMSTVALDLRAGDRVIYTAYGAFEGNLNTWATGGALVDVFNGTTTTQLQRTGTSVNTEIQPLFNEFCFVFGIFCTGSVPVGSYDTHMGLRNWRIFGEYVVPANGNYTFAVKAARVEGTGILTTGGTPTVNPNMQGALKVEVFRP